MLNFMAIVYFNLICMFPCDVMSPPRKLSMFCVMTAAESREKVLPLKLIQASTVVWLLSLLRLLLFHSILLLPMFVGSYFVLV